LPIAEAIGEGDIGWWARDGEQVDWALCCLARKLVAEGAVEDYCRLVDQDAEEKLDLMTRIMTPRAWINGYVFDSLPEALARVMGVNVLVVSRSPAPNYHCREHLFLGDEDSPEEFQIRVLSYNNHYFWWRPPGAGILRDKVCIQEKYKIKVEEQARKKRKRDRAEEMKRTKKRKKK
jgi:hypothetical protein